MKALKYIGIFCLLAVALSMTFCSVGVYQGFQTANRIFAGADNYTCRQFYYDVDHAETDKFPALVIATVAYGTTSDPATQKQHQNEVIGQGMEPAVRKVYALCKDKPSERVLNLFTATITGATTISETTVSSTAPVSSTTPNKTQNNITSPTAPAISQ